MYVEGRGKMGVVLTLGGLAVVALMVWVVLYWLFSSHEPRS